jgi:hypothetical protein
MAIICSWCKRCQFLLPAVICGRVYQLLLRAMAPDYQW